MPIDFACECGKKYRSKDQGAGRAFQCSECGRAISVPDNSPGPTQSKPGLSDPLPAKPSPIPPMNGVGLFSLMLSILSYLPLSFALLLAGVWAWNIPDSIRYMTTGVMAIYSIVATLLAGFGLLVCRLGAQRVVRPFAIWGLRLAAIPLILSCLSAALARLPAFQERPILADKPPAVAPSGLAKDSPGYLSRPGTDEDSELWKDADPEALSGTWAAGLREGNYSIRSGCRIGSMFVGFVEDRENGQEYAIKAGPFAKDVTATIEMWPTKP